MRLMGSRLTKTDDPFSDWDYLVESAADFEEMAARMPGAISSVLYEKGHLRILTLIDGDGTLWDYSGSYAAFPDDWDRVAGGFSNAAVGDFWVISFKVLKATYRDHPILADLGIELAVSAARDLYMARKYDALNYKDFFAFKAVAARIADDDTLCSVTGLPYATRPQRLAKMTALADLVAGIDEGSKEPRRVFGQRLDVLG